MFKSKIAKYLENNTDKYFTSTKQIVDKFGDAKVVYVIFLRQSCIYAPHFILELLQKVKKDLKANFTIFEPFKEGDIAESGRPLFYLEGSFIALTMLETLVLQKVGWPNIAAFNAYNMALALPNTKFISMGARHYAGPEMANIIDYGISVGSQKAKEQGALGFLGSSTLEGSRFFGLKQALGTMPHALIGYAKSTLEAAKLYHQTFKNDPLTVLVDYFGTEVTDALELCHYFKDLAIAGKLSVRIDTTKSRYLEGLDDKSSKEIFKTWVQNYTLKDFTSLEQEDLVGPGVSAAAIFKMRQELDSAGFEAVKIVASSGFNLDKCRLMGKVKAPIDVVGTGSVISSGIDKTYATADIIAYNGDFRVKKGRENFIKDWQNFKAKV